MTSVTSSPARGRLTSGDKWKAPRPTPVRIIALGVVIAFLAGFGVWWAFLRPTPPPPAPIVAEPTPHALSAVEQAGVSALLNQFAGSARDVKGEINDGELKLRIDTSVTADGRFGFGTVNAANIDGEALLADGDVFLRGPSTFWAALGINYREPAWVKVHPDFIGGRIFFPVQNVTAALTPVEESRILDNSYTANDKAEAVFGFNGLESVTLPNYVVTIRPGNNEGIFGTAEPKRNAMGPVWFMDRAGTAWIVNPPLPA